MSTPHGWYHEDLYGNNPTRSNLLLSGFQINYIVLRDEHTGKVYWSTNEDFSSPQQVHEVHLPKDIFRCRVVSREVNFSSVYEMTNFRVYQKLLFKGHRIEEWQSEYGRVIPHSISTWKTPINAHPEAYLLPFHVLTGHITIETYFYDGDLLITKSKVRLHYV